ncbi:MAG: PSD1 and planctomycete cytochrome C domain-containing protein, partial [Isosphaeraceae bacterium]
MAVAVLASTPMRGMAADGLDPAEVTFFETEVRPLLAENCLKCHGPKKQRGGLRLDSRAAVLAGGDSGPVVVPGKPADSLLVEAINYGGLEMPPTGKLDDAKRAALTRWIEMGAPWPGADPNAKVVASTPKSPGEKLTDDDRAFWSFQAPRKPAPPKVNDEGWSRNPIDGFIIAKLAAEGLSPAPEADRLALIRRVSFDLCGLPPTPAEVEAFVNDPAPDAYETLIDRLLASPRYGERWARHWLDLVRYAESDGYNKDGFRPNAWRYRDYIVQAFNEDKPYNQFMTEQLAGDELNPSDPTMRIAVSYLRLGTYEYNQRDVPGQWNAILNDITDVTSDVFLGLGMGCARCHDHKFDPILQRDYFRLRAFFAPILPREDLPLATNDAWQAEQDAEAVWNARTAAIQGQIAAIERPYLEASTRAAIAMFPEEMQANLNKAPGERTPLEEQLAQLAGRQVIEERVSIAKKVKGEDKVRLDALTKQLAELAKDRPQPLPTILTVTDVGPIAPPTTIPGDRSNQEIEPGFLTLLDPEPAQINRPPSAANSTGRRTTLARWLTKADHPLTSRVMVNRIWQYHFGRGLVGTSSDFGRLGDRPSHPELLDWLATEFVEHGWSVKQTHRLILTSATYRQSARRPTPEVARLKDPDNRWLWRMSTRRLDVEPIRDAMLSVSGELDPAIGGPSADALSPRRTLYTKTIRNKHDPLIESFDAPDGSQTTPSRNVTTTPIQALLMVNGPWPLARARSFADRLRREVPEDDRGRIDRAFRLAFGRPPDDS